MAMAASAPVSAPWNEAVEKVIDAPVEKAWAIAGDFLGFPSQHIDKVENVKGENGLPGCQRKFLYKNQKGGQNFVVEELMAIDAVNHKVSYILVNTDEIVEPGQEAYIQLTSANSHQVAVPLRKHSSRHRDVEPDLSTPVQHLDRGALRGELASDLQQVSLAREGTFRRSSRLSVYNLLVNPIVYILSSLASVIICLMMISLAQI